MKSYILQGVILLALTSGILQASEPKTGTLIQFGALGGWVVYTSYKVIRSLIKKR